LLQAADCRVQLCRARLHDLSGCGSVGATTAVLLHNAPAAVRRTMAAAGLFKVVNHCISRLVKASRA
jgi:hypothetical protein